MAMTNFKEEVVAKATCVQLFFERARCDVYKCVESLE